MASNPATRIRVANQLGHLAADEIFNAIDEVSAGVLTTTDLTLTGDMSVGDAATVTGEFRAKDKFFYTPTDADVDSFRSSVIGYYNGVVTSTADGLNGIYYDLDLQYAGTGADGVNGTIISIFGGVAADNTDLVTVATLHVKGLVTSFINTGSAVNAATIWIEDAPDQATNNYALWVDSGVSRFDGGIQGATAATPAGLLNTQGYTPIVSTYGTDTTPTTTSVYVTDMFVPCNMTLTGVTFMNGSAVGNGTVRIGLYDSAGVAIAGALTAATTTAGIDAYQKVPFAVAYAAVGPARYLIGFQWSSATDRFNCHPFGSAAYSIVQASATVGTTTISPLPTAFVTGAAVVASLY